MNRMTFITEVALYMLTFKSHKEEAIIDHVDNDDVKRASEMGGNDSLPPEIQPQTKFINESGLYTLIFGSKTI